MLNLIFTSRGDGSSQQRISKGVYSSSPSPPSFACFLKMIVVRPRMSFACQRGAECGRDLDPLLMTAKTRPQTVETHLHVLCMTHPHVVSLSNGSFNINLNNGTLGRSEDNRVRFFFFFFRRPKFLARGSTSCK